MADNYECSNCGKKLGSGLGKSAGRKRERCASIGRIRRIEPTRTLGRSAASGVRAVHAWGDRRQHLELDKSPYLKTTGQIDGSHG